MQEEQRAYNNREQCRDQFYAIIREAASAYSAFGWVSSGSEGEGFLKMKDAVHQFLHVLLVENYPWFAGQILSSHSFLASPSFHTIMSSILLPFPPDVFLPPDPFCYLQTAFNVVLLVLAQNEVMHYPADRLVL